MGGGEGGRGWGWKLGGGGCVYLVSSGENLQFLFKFGGFLGLPGHELAIGLQLPLHGLQPVLVG